MMRIRYRATKDDLLTAASGAEIPETYAAESVETERGMTLIWYGDTAYSLPHLILVQTHEDRVDTLAWATTYLGAMVPITAFSRVLLPEEFRLRMPPKIDPRLLGGCTALVMMEAQSLAGGSPTTRDCTATFSYVAARSVCGDPSGSIFLHVAEDYSKLMRALHEVARGEEQKRYLGAWSMLADLTSEQFKCSVDLPEVMRDACTEFWRDGELAHATLQRLVPDQDLRRIAHIPAMAMEERVRLFDQVATGVLRSGLRGVQGAFVLGYILSRVSDGTLRHVGLAIRLTSEISNILPWYAFCAGVQHRSKLAAGDDAAIALWIAREIQRDFHIGERPHCDIAAPELNILLTAHSFRAHGAIRGLRNVLVELAPGIETRVTIGGEPAVPEKGREQQLTLTGLVSDARVDTYRVQELLEEALLVLRDGTRDVRRRPRKR